MSFSSASCTVGSDMAIMKMPVSKASKAPLKLTSIHIIDITIDHM